MEEFLQHVLKRSSRQHNSLAKTLISKEAKDKTYGGPNYQNTGPVSDMETRLWSFDLALL